MTDLAKVLTDQELRTAAVMRKVTVETFGIYLLPPETRAEWAMIIASVLGDGPDSSAHFYFGDNAWRLDRIRQGDTDLPASCLIAVVAALQGHGKVVDVGHGRPAQR